jgi:hypothetical protein
VLVGPYDLQTCSATNAGHGSFQAYRTWLAALLDTRCARSAVLPSSCWNLSGYSQGARGYRGSTIGAFSSRSEISPPRPRRAMPEPSVTPSPRDSNRKASGKHGAVHPKGRGGA